VPTTDPPRRTQPERSAATRGALLDAALECLVEVGYANTTTSRVAERAGVSRGAHLHHFQTRTALVSAAAEHFAHRRVQQLRESVLALPAGPGRTDRALEELWETFLSPLFQGAVDLWAAARTDAELREALVPLERTLARETVVLCRTLFAEQAERPHFDLALETVLNTIRGLAVLDLVQPGTGAAAKQWERCKPLLAALIEGDVHA
jgi:AcrR family transcriptional regulator